MRTPDPIEPALVPFYDEVMHRIDRMATGQDIVTRDSDLVQIARTHFEVGFQFINKCLLPYDAQAIAELKAASQYAQAALTK